LQKEWPQKELDGLVAREIDGIKVIRDYSPTLSDRFAVSSDKGLYHVIWRTQQDCTRLRILTAQATTYWWIGYDARSAAGQIQSVFRPTLTRTKLAQAVRLHYSARTAPGGGTTLIFRSKSSALDYALRRADV
jgi:hypothetical protein